METEVSGLDLQTWLEENAPPPPVGENELTPMKASAKWNMNPQTAKRRLEKLTNEGKLEKVMRVHPNGQVHPAYLIVE